MSYPSVVTTFCKYCGKEIKVTRNDVLNLKDAKIIADSCCMKCRITRLFHLKRINNRGMKKLLVRVGTESHFTKMKVEYGGETYE
jgi:hypothetical protein